MAEYGKAVDNEDEVLELSAGKEPDLDIILDELQQAASDCNSYYQRICDARNWWNCWWPGQSTDGRCHKEFGNACWPWENGSDSRLRTVNGIIKDHVMMAKTAFWQAKIISKSMHPFQQARERTAAQKMLEWRVYTHQRSELLRELPLAWWWKYGGGCAVLSIQWERQRRIEETMTSLAELDHLAQVDNTGMASDLVDAIMDESQEDAVVAMIQAMSPILTKPQTRKIVTDLRDMKTVTIPVAYPFINKPVWMAKMPCVDILFPYQTRDLQMARWVAEGEWISESILRDRIVTDGYSEEFVEDALQHKGEPGSAFQVPQGKYRSNYIVPNVSDWTGYKDLVFLQHVWYRAMDSGVPCVYKTVFCESSMRKRKKNEPLYAWHGKSPYKHGQYPFVVFRRNYGDGPILEARGIAEEAYTDEADMKVQQDGITNRSDLLLNLPMIVPPMRVKAIENQWRPRGILGARPNEITWPNIPPIDATPVQVIEMIRVRLQDRYPLFGETIDPEKKIMYRQEIANDTLGEMELVFEQTLQLQQDLEMDKDIMRVVGPDWQTFKAGRDEIQGRYEITLSFDAKMTDVKYAAEKMGLFAQLLTFKGEAAVFNAAADVVDPDLADLLKEDNTSPAALEKERNDEMQAINAAMNGIEWPFPQFGNWPLRLQVLQQNTLQNPNPAFQQRLAQQQDSQEILKSRAENMMRQIQQYSTNPQVGRQLATQTFRPSQPAAVTTTR